MLWTSPDRSLISWYPPTIRTWNLHCPVMCQLNCQPIRSYVLVQLISAFLWLVPSPWVSFPQASMVCPPFLYFCSVSGNLLFTLLLPCLLIPAFWTLEFSRHYQKLTLLLFNLPACVGVGTQETRGPGNRQGNAEQQTQTYAKTRSRDVGINSQHKTGNTLNQKSRTMTDEARKSAVNIVCLSGVTWKQNWITLGSWINGVV